MDFYVSAIGGIMMVVAVILYFFAPQKINHFIGYRTSRSKSSQQSWNYAQKYASKIFFAGGFIAVVINLLSGIFKGTFGEAGPHVGFIPCRSVYFLYSNH